MATVCPLGALWIAVLIRSIIPAPSTCRSSDLVAARSTAGLRQPYRRDRDLSRIPPAVPCPCYLVANLFLHVRDPAGLRDKPVVLLRFGLYRCHGGQSSRLFLPQILGCVHLFSTRHRGA